MESISIWKIIVRRNVCTGRIHQNLSGQLPLAARKWKHSLHPICQSFSGACSTQFLTLPECSGLAVTLPDKESLHQSCGQKHGHQMKLRKYQPWPNRIAPSNPAASPSYEAGTGGIMGNFLVPVRTSFLGFFHRTSPLRWVCYFAIL